MGRRFEEIDWQQTPLGAISLRRRLEPSLHVDVYEVKLGEEFLMSSLFTVAEIELARLGLAALDRDRLQVLVGGLGLGYTAMAALDDPRVRSLTVIEALGPVIGWHEQQLLPDTRGLASDPRTTLVRGDFFALMQDPRRLPAAVPDRYDAVLLDIDHSPRHVLHPSHTHFYSPEGLGALRCWLTQGGVFAIWSDDPPDPAFTGLLSAVFASATAHVVAFPNPLTGGISSNTVYVATR